MPTELFGYEVVEGRRVVAAFDREQDQVDRDAEDLGVGRGPHCLSRRPSEAAAGTLVGLAPRGQRPRRGRAGRP